MDALDECNDYNNTRQNLLVQFQKLASARIFITSRPHITDVHTYFETYSELEVRASDDDIRAYALERISIQSRISRLVQEDKLLRDEILQSNHCKRNVDSLALPLCSNWTASLI